MKINNIPRSGAIHQYRNNQDSKLDNTQGKKEKQKDELQISTEAKKLHGAQTLSNSNVNSDKVQQLKESVSSGTYVVEADKIAEKLYPYFK